jgi:DNA-binding NtrC family response regulator
MSPNSRSVKVLVVDDEILIVDTLCAVLRIRGYDASAVYSAEDALDWCRLRCPDAVITDVIMGPINGVQLAIHLAETLPHCKVLLVSDHALMATTIADSMASGYRFHTLAKPVNPQEIFDFLETVSTLNL